MKNTLRSKTLTASLPQPPASLYSWANNPETWAKKQNLRFLRNDHTRSLDIVVPIESAELTLALRVLSNGEGSELVMTLVQPRGQADSSFHEHVRWAEGVLRAARKAPVAAITEIAGEATANPEIATPAAAVAAVDPGPTTGKKLFIGNLPYDWNEEMLSGIFRDVAETTRVEIARYRGRNGRSRGFAFVEMISDEAAQTAIDKLHESMAGTRKIIVRRARSQESRPAPEAPAAAPVGAPSTAAPLADGEEDPNDSIGNRITDPEPNTMHRSRPMARPHRSRVRTPLAPRAPRAPQGRTRASRLDRPYKEIDIVNNSGYEYFPRRTREK